MESEERECVYCGKHTPYYECVDQVPSSVCSMTFLLNELLTTTNRHLLKDDFVCCQHEDIFHLKYLCFMRNEQFSKTCHATKHSGKEHKSCAYCGNHEPHLKYMAVSRCNLKFQDFLVNTGSQRSSRSGTGIHQADVLCESCYQLLRRKYVNLQKGENYSPIKRPAGKKSKFTSPVTRTPSDTSMASPPPSCSSLGSPVPMSLGSPTASEHGEVFKSPTHFEKNVSRHKFHNTIYSVQRIH